MSTPTDMLKISKRTLASNREPSTEALGVDVFSLSNKYSEGFQLTSSPPFRIWDKGCMSRDGLKHYPSTDKINSTELWEPQKVPLNNFACHVLRHEHSQSQHQIKSVFTVSGHSFNCGEQIVSHQLDTQVDGASDELANAEEWITRYDVTSPDESTTCHETEDGKKGVEIQKCVFHRSTIDSEKLQWKNSTATGQLTMPMPFLGAGIGRKRLHGLHDSLKCPLEQPFSRSSTPDTILHRRHQRQTRAQFLLGLGSQDLCWIDTTGPKQHQPKVSSSHSYGCNLSSNESFRPVNLGESIERSAESPESITIELAYSLDPTKELPIKNLNEVLVPTIRTVEATANAKAFLEVYFDTLLGNLTSSRDARKLELEGRISRCRYDNKGKSQIRKKWFDLESYHLRCLRVSRSKYTLPSSFSWSPLKAGYEFIKILGKGSFGVVRLAQRVTPLVEHLQSARLGKAPVEEKPTLQPQSNVYAIKTIRKSDMLRGCQDAHIRAERDALAASVRSRWIVPLVESFQDRHNLYLVMEFMAGGDFLGLLIRLDRIEEKHARFYVAEMVLCLEEVHRLGYVHRDVKPDNFLISASGHLKISDFGLAFDGHWSHDQNYYNHQRYSLLERLGISVTGDDKNRGQSQIARSISGKSHASSHSEEQTPFPQGIIASRNNSYINRRLQSHSQHEVRLLAHSVVGTSQYMAPEVIRGEHYDGRCDWWSLGIIIFECLYGETPFIGKDRQATKFNVLKHKGEIRFIPNLVTDHRFRVSVEARDIMNRLLREKEARLSCPAYFQNDMAPHCSYRAQSADSSVPVGRLLYPDDAADIKAHPFFSGIDWSHLHLMSPPVIPQISSRSDTRYFEQMSADGCYPPMSWSSTSSERSSAEEIPLPQPGGWSRHDYLGITKNAICSDPLKVAKTRTAYRCKGQCNPRDFILRDARLTKKALEVRKEGAFIGYSYRQPYEVLTFLESLK